MMFTGFIAKQLPTISQTINWNVSNHSLDCMKSPHLLQEVFPTIDFDGFEYGHFG